MGINVYHGTHKIFYAVTARSYSTGVSIVSKRLDWANSNGATMLLLATTGLAFAGRQSCGSPAFSTVSRILALHTDLALFSPALAVNDSKSSIKTFKSESRSKIVFARLT